MTCNNGTAMLANLSIRVYFIILVVMNHLQPTATKSIEKKSNYSNTTNYNHQCSQMLCSESNYDCFGIDCSESGPIVQYGHCVTFSEDTNLLTMSMCRYFEPEVYNVTGFEQILLPRNLSQLNDYMCGPLNRKGLVCSECADGFGPSVTSFGYRCVNCTDAWYGVPLFLFLQFVPISVLYFVILVFQIKVLTAPMPCFIMYAQLVVIVFDSDSYFSFTDTWNITLDLKIMLTFYGIFNLDFGRHINILPPYCLSNKLKFIHVAFLGYISAFYPILLIFLTWACVHLHGRNFRPLVWLWRPFHRCFVRLRRGWDTKSDITDVFATFFFLSYSKILYQTLVLTLNEGVKNINESGSYFLTYHSPLDPSISYASTYQLSLAIPVALITIILIIPPPLFLLLYPIKTFRSCLSKCGLNFIAIHIFIDKVYSCYKNSLDGGRDMRSFAGLYFVLRIAACLGALLSHLVSKYLFIGRWLTLGTLLFFTTLTIAIARPYQKAYMNYWDIAILSHLAVLSNILSSGIRTLLLARILLNIPIAVFVLTIVCRKCYHLYKAHLLRKCCNCFQLRRSAVAAESNQSSTVDSLTAAEPLIQPTSTVLNYGIDDNEGIHGT